jgi:hypothetical protein
LLVSKLQFKTKNGEKRKMSTPILGRNARLLKSGVAIGYGKNISVKASAELTLIYNQLVTSKMMTTPAKWQ